MRSLFFNHLFMDVGRRPCRIVRPLFTIKLALNREVSILQKYISRGEFPVKYLKVSITTMRKTQENHLHNKKHIYPANRVLYPVNNRILFWFFRPLALIHYKKERTSQDSFRAIPVCDNILPPVRAVKIRKGLTVYHYLRTRTPNYRMLLHSASCYKLVLTNRTLMDHSIKWRQNVQNSSGTTSHSRVVSSKSFQHFDVISIGDKTTNRTKLSSICFVQ